MIEPSRRVGGSGETVLEIRHLVKTYGDRRAVDDVSLSVQAGEIFGLLGPNGAGKTTTLEIVEGLRQADSGTVRVFGLDPAQHLAEIRARLGVSLQKSRYWGLLTVKETLELFRSLYPKTLPVAELVDLFDLHEKLGARMKQLSGGQYQRVVLALALVNDPDLVLLDEPTIGLDPEARRRLWETIRRLRARGKTVILTTHYMDEAHALSDRVAILHRGQVVELGTPNELIRAKSPHVSVRFTTVQPFDPAGLALEPWCLDSRPADEGGFQAIVPNLREGLAGLIGWAERQGITLDELETRAATLEDVFLTYASSPSRVPATQADLAGSTK
jgi:ABC-2 type transport system ATP-binding protein